MKSVFLLAVINLFAVAAAFADDGVVKDIVVYKSPDCGCCSKWVSYLEQHDCNETV